MKRIWQIGIVLVIIFAIGFFVRSQFQVTVQTAHAVSGKAVNAVTGTVEVLAYMDIDVKAQHRGQITETPVVAGQQVAAGDVIAVQASEDLDLRIEQVRIRLDAARERAAIESRHLIDLETMEEQIKGVQLAVDLGQTPASRLNDLIREQRKLQVNLGLERINEKEQMELLENQLEQLQLQKDQVNTVAPFAGTVATIKAFRGDLVNGGQSLIRLVSHGRYVIMELTEEDYFGVEDGQRVTLRLASYPDRVFPGKVTRLEDMANSSSKTRNVIVTVEADESLLVPGLSGEGFLVKSERENAVLLPRRALLGNLVYVVEDGRVAVRRVQPGFIGLNQVEILEGIAVGDEVILEDQNLLKPGDKVNVEQL